MPKKFEARRSGDHLSAGGKTSSMSMRTKIRAREPIGRSFGLIRGKFPSRKMGRMIHWESQLERDAVLLLEFSLRVIEYREQPFTIYYTANGDSRRYTPDFEVTLDSGEIIVAEVKPAKRIQEPALKEKFGHIQEHFNRRQRPFCILTEAEIRRPELLANLRMLLRHRDKSLTNFQRRQFAMHLSTLKSFSFGCLTKEFGDPAIVWVLLDERLIFCDLTVRVTDQTVFVLNLTGGGDDYLHF
jgi:hypothetical protein